MGSPNFNTNVLRPSFAIEDNSYQHEGELSQQEAQDNANNVSELYQEAELLIHEAMSDYDFLFYQLKIKSGYNSGFQIYVDEQMSAEDVSKSFFIDFISPSSEEPMVGFIDQNGYVINENDDQIDVKALARVVQTDPNDEDKIALVKDERAIKDLVEQEYHVAFHYLGTIAQNLGLQPIVGESWVSSVSNDQTQTEKVIERLIIPELIKNDEQESGVQPAPSM